MRIVKRVLSTYSADNFGVCSALYELGGLVVMHDASGCNSTYNTHDEPRWYDMDSLVFISGLTEKNAIFGNDDKLIADLVTAAEEFHPNFIAVCGGPLPHIIGTDFRAVAKAVERECGIPTFGFQTNGMDSYISGAGQALEALVSLMGDGTNQQRSQECGSRMKHLLDSDLLRGANKQRSPKCGGPRQTYSVNILGATPLDFSLNGSVDALKNLLEKEGFRVRSTWAMGDTLENLLSSSDADVNLVVSAVGLRSAVAMEKRFGIPYVIGLPAGKQVTAEIFALMRQKAGIQPGDEDKALRLKYPGNEGKALPIQQPGDEDKALQVMQPGDEDKALQVIQPGDEDKALQVMQPEDEDEDKALQVMQPGDEDKALQVMQPEDEDEDKALQVMQPGDEDKALQVKMPDADEEKAHSDFLIIGEPVQSLAIRKTLEGMYPGKCARIVSPMHGLPKEIIDLGCGKIEREDELREVCRSAGFVIADPLYARLLPDEADKFIPLPHVAYSGRYYEDDVPVLVGEALDNWVIRNLL